MDRLLQKIPNNKVQLEEIHTQLKEVRAGHQAMNKELADLKDQMKSELDTVRVQLQATTNELEKIEEENLKQGMAIPPEVSRSDIHKAFFSGFHSCLYASIMASFEIDCGMVDQAKSKQSDESDFIIAIIGDFLPVLSNTISFVATYQVILLCITFDRYISGKVEGHFQDAQINNTTTTIQTQEYGRKLSMDVAKTLTLSFASLFTQDATIGNYYYLLLTARRGSSSLWRKNSC